MPTNLVTMRATWNGHPGVPASVLSLKDPFFWRHIRWTDCRKRGELQSSFVTHVNVRSVVSSLYSFMPSQCVCVCVCGCVWAGASFERRAYNPHAASRLLHLWQFGSSRSLWELVRLSGSMDFAVWVLACRRSSIVCSYVSAPIVEPCLCVIQNCGQWATE